MKIRRPQTKSQKKAELKREWVLIDGQDRVLGQLATEIAHKLQGKHKPSYTPHLDGGDYIVLVNAAKVTLTGAKAHKKIYTRHSNYPGGLVREDFATLQARDPEAIIRLAVKGMLPDNKLRDGRLKRLKVFPDDKHPYQNFIKNNG